MRPNMKRNEKISQKKRNVFESSLFKVPAHLEKGYQKLKDKILKGEDINKYQGKGIFNHDEIDELFIFEDIKHLHLGFTEEINKVIKKPMMKRTKELAMVLVKEDAIYFLKIDEDIHDTKDDWFGEEYLEILSNEFPKAIEDRKTEIIEGTKYNKEKVSKCRKLGINYPNKTKNQKTYLNKTVMLGTKKRAEEIVMDDIISDWIRSIKS